MILTPHHIHTLRVPSVDKCKPPLGSLVAYKRLNGNKKKVYYSQFQNNIIIFGIKKVFNLDDTRLKGEKRGKVVRSSPRGKPQEQNSGHPPKGSWRPRPGLWPPASVHFEFHTQGKAEHSTAGS